MTDEPTDEIGPVDFLVVEFPADASNFTGEMAAALADLSASGTIRVLDVIVVRKDEDGSIEALEIDDLERIPEFADIEDGLAELLAATDVAHLAEAIDNGNTAGVLVWENLWAVPFARAARRAGGQLVASGRIPVRAIAAALEDDDLEQGD